MTELKTPNDFIPHFDFIAPSIWEYTPRLYTPAPFPPKDVDSPSLIILCTWTGAQPRYIAKYTAEYQALFPSSRILLITTSAKDLCFRNSMRKQHRMKPAVERISSFKYLNERALGSSGILLHVFSEGGSNKACELAKAYYNITATRLPVSALSFDSTPGHPRYMRLCQALNKSLPQVPVLRHVAMLFASITLGVIWILYTGVKGYENNVISRTRRRLQDPVYFDPNAPRCYLYSKGDSLISWQDVQEHAEESICAGMCVEEVLFEGSGHVGHAKEEPGRYWDAVLATWRRKDVMKEKQRDMIEKRQSRVGILVQEEELWRIIEGRRELGKNTVHSQTAFFWV
jgi:hypothetical protein